MTKNCKSFLLMYGFFLGWLMSFIYSGPLFSFIVDQQQYSYSLLFTVMFLVPAVAYVIIGNLNINEETRRIFLPLSIATCLLSTLIYLLLGNKPQSAFTLTVLIVVTLTAGISTMLFIISSTAYFIKIVPLDSIFKGMALIILIANTIVYMVEILLHHGFVVFAIIVNLLTITISLALAFRIRDREEIVRPDYDIEMPRKTLLILCGAFFLLNIGGGVVFAVVEPAALEQSSISTYLYILPYILAVIAMLTINKRVLRSVDILLTIAAGLVAIGLLLFQFSHISALTTNMFIQVGYAMLDIILWGLVGKMCFVYGKPYKITSMTMSANITAVFFGMAGGRILVNRMEDPILAITLIATVCIITAIMAMPFIHRITIKDLKKGMENIRRNQQRLEDLVRMDNMVLLTAREQEIVEMMLIKKTNHDIANALYISENTLKTHAKSIYAKLQVKNKKELQDLLKPE